TLPLLLPNGSPFPVRDLAIFIAAAVIVLSLVGASVGLPPLLKKLERPLESGAGQEGDHARAVAAHAAITAVRNALSEMQQSAPADAGICAGAASRVITLYRRRIHDDVLEDTTPKSCAARMRSSASCAWWHWNTSARRSWP